ncbi:MAG: HAMP domain-containing histidine kinase [Proteobacteria bacterium]|nr:HAMP domain-containing histidine kinase [Pseudomonadota bacterium]
MKPFSSLLTKILFWLFLNMAVIAGVLFVFFAFQFQMDLNAFFGRQTFDRMHVAGRLISYELSKTNRANWSDVLTRHSKINHVNFALVLEDGTQYLSKDMGIPSSVMKTVVDSLKPPPPPDDFQLSTKLSKNQEMQKQYKQEAKHVEKPRIMMRTQNPARYWARILVPIPIEHPHQHPPAMLIAVSDSITGNGFFFDPLPWIIAVASILFISILFWIPLVRNITRPIVRMTHTAEEITRGNFDVRIKEPRTDEIGRLASAINHMTSRLDAYMKGQKRFLGDVAHELGSPIARIQFGLGILEQRADEDNLKRVADVIEDVAHMSNLVNELLSFSRAETNPLRVKPIVVQLLPIIERVVQRESLSATKIIIDAGHQIKAIADPELLSRAIANVVRNSIRYAANTGPVLIKTERKEKKIVIELRDSGPGVPEDLLDQLFEPFYRIEPSRNRDSGGVGLGLAIVKTCIEACGGTVSARNLKPKGFAVTIILKANK